MEKEETKDRELAAIRLAKDEIKVKDCFVFTWDADGVLEDGVKIVPVWKFCLEKKYLGLVFFENFLNHFYIKAEWSEFVFL